jgi:hypothetical protein
MFLKNLRGEPMAKRVFLIFAALFFGLNAQTSTPAKKSAPAKKTVTAPTAPPEVQQAKPQPSANELTVDQVCQLVQVGLSEDLIIAKIKKNNKAFDLSTEQILQLKKVGASDNIIRVLMDPQAQPVITPITPPAPATAPAVEPPKSTSAAAEQSGRELVLRDGTEVKLKLTKPISSADARVGDRVELEASGDVVVDGVVLIKKGAPAVGQVTEAQPRKSFGRRGKLNFTIDYVKTVDGQNVRLRSTREAKGADSYGTAGVVTILAGPFGALVKGKDVELGAGTEFTIFIDGDRTIKLK